MAEQSCCPLYKTTNVDYTEGVIGQRCVEWAPPPPPPRDVTPPPPPIYTPPPPYLPPEVPACPAMTVTYSRVNGVCMGFRVPVGAPSSFGVPAECGGTPYPAPDSYCG